MVTIIKSGTSISKAFHYNEDKVKKGEAELQLVQNYPVNGSVLTPDLRLGYLQKVAGLNSRTSVNLVHISVNFAPGEEIEKEKLWQISVAYMKGIGFGYQPYLVYRHTDAGHPHLHIVTTNIELDGRRISLYRLGKFKSEPTRKSLEKQFGLVPAGKRQVVFEAKPIARLEYGKTETKRGMEHVLENILKNYRFTSLQELNVLLKEYRIVADRGTESSRIYKNRGLVYQVLDAEGNRIGKPVKASSFCFKATLNAIESRFEPNELLRKTHLKSIRSAIDLALLKMPENSLDKMLERLEKQGIVSVIRKNREGLLSGISFIDYRTRCVFEGSSIGKEYGVKALVDRIQKQGKAKIGSGSLAKSSAMTQGKDATYRWTMQGSATGSDGSDNTCRALLETISTPEVNYDQVLYERRKKKKKLSKQR